MIHVSKGFTEEDHICRVHPIYSFWAIRKKAGRTAVMPFSAITAHYTKPCFILCSVSFSRSPLEQLEAEKGERELKLKKMQQEMEQVFEMKVKEKKKKLKDSETEVRVVGWARFNPKNPDIKIKKLILLRWTFSFSMQIVGRSC